MNQQPNAFDGLPIDRPVKDIVEFKEEHPLPFRDTDNGEGTEGWTFFEFLSGWKFEANLWWKFDQGVIIGFESEGRKMFLGIAKIVISFHEKKMFSGNLLGRLRILPDLNVTHKSSPQGDKQAFEDGGQRSDIDHFRWMVAAVVRTAFPYSIPRILSPNFLLFFSEIFTLKEGLKYYFVSQLYHPIFFNSSDRCNLIRMIRDLFNLNRRLFRSHFTLNSYGYSTWWSKIQPPIQPPSRYSRSKTRYAGAFLDVLHYNGNFDSLYKNSNGFALPLYIRNVHEHFSQKGGGCHEDIDFLINSLFPGISAVIIDSAIRNLHGYWSLFGSNTTTLPYLQRSSPHGWCFASYRFLN